MKNGYELLAPAGSFDKLKYALKFGADAVYAGLPDFSLRARINKFNKQDIIQAVEYTHSKNKKIYITVNIFAHNRHLEILKTHLPIFKDSMPDAFIVSDIGIMESIKKFFPLAQIHLSTQANTTNWQAAKFWHDYGVSRIILARELKLDEIKEIHKKVPKLELECFVHGAMCMAYSGRCLLSAWKTGRSSNLGDCAQNCRWKYSLKYSLVEEGGPDKYIHVEEDKLGSYLLNSKDLCLIEFLDDLKKVGITSFKIEGRAKSVYYLAQVVKAYRSALNIESNNPHKKTRLEKLKKELCKLVNRTFTTGFLFGECRFKGQETRFSHIEERYKFVGEVLEYDKNKRLVKVKVHNALCVGDRVEFIQPNKDNMLCKIKNIYDDGSMEKLNSAHGGQNRLVYVEINKIPEKFSILRKRTKTVTRQEATFLPLQKSVSN